MYQFYSKTTSYKFFIYVDKKKLKKYLTSKCYFFIKIILKFNTLLLVQAADLIKKKNTIDIIKKGIRIECPYSWL